MNTLYRAFFAAIVTATLSLTALADAGPPVEACGFVGCILVVYIAIILFVIAFAIAIIVFIFKWIKKDARSRGMPNADSVCFLGLLGLLGLLIYVLTRPQGNTQPCHACGNQRMDGLPLCPHCGQR